MSTDRQLHHQLPKPQVSGAKEIVGVPTDQNDAGTTAKLCEGDNNINGQDKNVDEESYNTPTSKENRIPEMLNCPPAPQKPKRGVSCKRKLLGEIQIVTKDEIDAVFGSTYPNKKRTCRCT